MGFFQDLKEDLSLAVNELLPNDEKLDEQAEADQDAAATLQEEPVEEADADELTGQTDQVLDEPAETVEEVPVMEEPAEEAEDDGSAEEAEDDGPTEEVDEADDVVAETQVVEDATAAEETDNAPDITAAIADALDKEADETIADLTKEIEVPKLQPEDAADTSFEKEVYEAVMKNDNDNKQVESELEKAVDEVMEERVESVMGQDVIDETAIVTKGMKVNGDISSQGSMDVFGDIKGNIEVLGKLNVAGTIEGNSNAAEVFSDAAHITGDIHATGSIKVGLNSVIIGNIYATSAVIAGAIKGDIDVHGPVVLDSSAIVMGNIKSKSVQMNNGAVIEGFCSQCYADVDVEGLFA